MFSVFDREEIIMHFGILVCLLFFFIYTLFTFSSQVFMLNPGFCILDFSGGLGHPAELHPGCWIVPRPGGYPHLISTA